MEDVLLSVALGPVFETLKSLALREFAKAWGLEADLDDLENTFSTIQAVLRDAEQKQWKSEAVKNWLKRLKVAAEEAEDVIDEFFAQAAIRKVKRERGLLHRAGTFFSLPNRLLFRLKLGEKIIEVNKKLDKIVKARQFHLTPNLEEDHPNNAARETFSQLIEPKIVGRGDDKEKIINALLLKNDSSEQIDSTLFVYAICGMGGLGKTTLAKLVYDDPRMDKEFKLKIWISVSDDFGTSQLVRVMLESIDGRGCDIQSLDVLHRRLQEKIGGKRFLLVLDDVWNENAAKWEAFKNVLMTCGGRRGIVVVTTRIPKIATFMANSIHYLDQLSQDDSWSLFLQSFGADTIENYMEIIGKAMLINCHGVPLAVKVLGRLMQTKKGEDEWRLIMESGTWNSQDDETIIFSTLKLSYDHLSPHLRKCFAYCSVFPRDFEMRKDDLIHLWMANGFIPLRRQAHWYDIGQEIFGELISRFFIQDKTEDINEGTLCDVHDLMHYLASKMISGECFSSEAETSTENSKDVRHLYYDMSDSTKQKKVFSASFPLLRSLLIMFPEAPIVSNVSTLPSIESNHLRALHASRCCKAIPRAIKCRELIHLRYLNLSYSDIEVLPKSIIYLQNLQTLNLKNCKSLRELPKDLKYLKKLGFLEIGGCYALKNMPDMTQLKTQQILVSGLMLDSGNQITDVGEINPCGDLVLGLLQNIKNPEAAERANLKAKRNIQFLWLSWGGDEVNTESEGIMEALQPHPSLKHLRISMYPGSKFPTWFIDLRLQNLTSVRLDNTTRCHFLPPLEKLPFLETLMLAKLHSVKYIITEHYEGEDVKLFPSLKNLHLQDMPSLVGWSRINGMRRLLFPQLVRAYFIECRQLDWLTLNELSPSSKELYFKSCDLKKFPEEGVENLKSLNLLYIESCYNLVSLPTIALQSLSSLSGLYIYDCQKFATLSDDVKALTSLRFLTIENCPKMKTLPEEGLRHLNSLNMLYVGYCEVLSSLPDCVGDLSSLLDMEISFCPSLVSIPDGLRNSTSLQRLKIHGCPQLERRCNKNSGEDWPKIAHIPYIWIDTRLITEPSDTDSVSFVDPFRMDW